MSCRVSPFSYSRVSFIAVIGIYTESVLLYVMFVRVLNNFFQFIIHEFTNTIIIFCIIIFVRKGAAFGNDYDAKLGSRKRNIKFIKSTTEE